MEEKLELLNDILKGLGESFRIEFKIVHKNNETLFGLCLAGGNVAPTVYVNKDEFLNESNETIIKELRDIYNGQQITFSESMTSREFILEHVYPRLIGIDNLFWVEDDKYVHKNFLDMIVLYYVKIPSSESEFMSYTLLEPHIVNAGISLEELDSVAISNLKQQVDIKRIGDVISEALGEPIEDEFGIRILTNTWKTNGAAVILIDDLLNDISEMFGDDFVILPSSIHECLAVPVGMAMNLNEMLDLVRSVNETTLEPKDKLTDNVYIYDGSLRAYK